MNRDVIYEASAVAVGEESGSINFVSNRSDTPEGAKRGLRSRAIIENTDAAAYGGGDYYEWEDIELETVEVVARDPDSGKIVKRIEQLA